MDVAVWLRSLGLERYEALFRENDIDAEVLSDLTDGDLEKIGVSLGHRKRLLKAAAALAAGPAPAPPAAAAPVPPGGPADAAERRQLTVMFSDLVGSTAVSARLDPEDMRQVIRAYQDACSGVVARYDGFIAKFMGDGVLAYFGFPRAHEDDAARAVHAGLEIAEVVAGLQTRARKKLGVRVGTRPASSSWATCRQDIAGSTRRTLDERKDRSNLRRPEDAESRPSFGKALQQSRRLGLQRVTSDGPGKLFGLASVGVRSNALEFLGLPPTSARVSRGTFGCRGHPPHAVAGRRRVKSMALLIPGRRRRIRREVEAFHQQTD